jgi:hypothetical protein
MGSPREILSPAVARNAYASYHVVVRSAPRSKFTLYVGQNPDNAVQVTLYKESHAPDGIPDLLQQVLLPYEGTTDTAGLAVFWLDLFVGSDAPVRRIKVEPQIHSLERWVTYPMEVRIAPPIVPVHPSRLAALPQRSARSDVVAYGPWREALCAAPEPITKERTVTIRSLIHRNVQQDLALAKKSGIDRIWPGLLEAAGMQDVKSWCAASQNPPIPALSPEWYLRVRDFLYRTALH